MESKEMIKKPVDQYIVNFKTLVENNDVLLEILDSRDPIGTRFREWEDFIKKSGKELTFVLNYKNDMPEEKVFEWKNLFSTENKVIVISENNEKPADILNFIHLYQNKSVGIFGSPKVGKNYVLRLLSKEYSNLPIGELRVDENVVKIPICSPSIFSILRNVNNLSDIFYKDIMINFLSNVNKEDFCVHFAIPNFKDCNELIVILSERYKIHNKSKSASFKLVAELILKDFYEKKILFWRNDESDSSIVLWYR